MIKKKFILCADDYAQTESISSGILALVRQKRLSAVSCMTQSPLWLSHAEALLPFAPLIDVGLHFNLTHPFEKKAMHLNCVIGQSVMRILPRKKIQQMLNTQLDRFEVALNKAPDFIDGHQHVHVFPQIRQIVFETLKERYPKQKPYLRLTLPNLRGPDVFHKALVLHTLTLGFKKQATQKGFSFPPFFTGLYSFAPKINYGRFFNKALQRISSGTLFMCHPGHLGNFKENDPIAFARSQEFSYLASPAFLKALLESNFEMVRFQDLFF